MRFAAIARSGSFAGVRAAGFCDGAQGAASARPAARRDGRGVHIACSSGFWLRASLAGGAGVVAGGGNACGCAPATGTSR